MSYLDSSLFFTYLLPSARGWEESNDRSVICFVTTTGQELTVGAGDKGEGRVGDTMGKPCAVSGAMIMCSFGLAPSTLSVVAPRPTVEGRPVATITDVAPGANIAPFGMCQSLANPTVAAATAAALGVLTPMPCVPVVPAPWTPLAPQTTGRRHPGPGRRIDLHLRLRRVHLADHARCRPHGGRLTCIVECRARHSFDTGLTSFPGLEPRAPTKERECPLTPHPVCTSKKSSSTQKVLSAAPTAVAAFVGFTERSPTDDPADPEGLAPRLVTSWTQFESLFGSFTPGAVLPLSVYGYFANGGSLAYIVRVPNTAPSGEPSRREFRPPIGRWDFRSLLKVSSRTPI